MDSLNDLRAQAIAREKAARAKMARVKRNTGAEVRGTRYDPLKGNDAINRMTRVQVQYHLDRVNNFVSRRTQFVSSSTSGAISTTDWNRFKATESRVNARNTARMEQRGDVWVGGDKEKRRGMTLRERATRMVSQDMFRRHDTTAGSPYGTTDYQPWHVKDAESLAKLQKRLSGRDTKVYVSKKTRSARYKANEMLKELGLDEEMEKLGRLSNAQFETLWNWTDYADNLGRWYVLEQSGGRGISEQAFTNIVEDDAREFRAGLDWAATLDRRTGSTKEKKKATRKR